MDINQLIAIIKKKIVNDFVIENIDIEDKSFYIKIILEINQENII